MINNSDMYGKKSYFLKPADLYMTSEQMVIKTVLGSCVTLTMFSPETGVSAACHAVLPSCQDCSCASNVCMNKYKFVQCVIPEMLKRFKRLGIAPADIEIKMFGGADMIMVRKGSRSWDNQRVGRKNIVMARDVAREHHLIIKSSDVGGTLGRKLYFDTETGEVCLKRLSRSVPNEGLLKQAVNS